MIFETERLIVREWRDTPDDLDRIFEIYRHAEVTRWIGMEQPLQVPDEARAVMTRWQARYEKNEHRYGPWAMELKATGVVAGTVLLGPLPEPSDGSEGRGEIEVGWHLHPDSWGHGYATEAATGALDLALNQYQVAEVYAVAYPTNERSIAVMKRLGMSPRGLTTRWYGREAQCYVTLPRQRAGSN
ncbi:GNAT family N-acetyltransferase [Hamadaea sp. NPDC050747]|uniref:GNAT family N-acetyltransferase n=1 Tax=Hamadaea sp. NPDC050747 TaxID=3155789 RepID=UPI0033D609D3